MKLKKINTKTFKKQKKHNWETKKMKGKLGKTKSEFLKQKSSLII